MPPTSLISNELVDSTALVSREFLEQLSPAGAPDHSIVALT